MPRIRPLLAALAGVAAVWGTAVPVLSAPVGGLRPVPAPAPVAAAPAPPAPAAAAPGPAAPDPAQAAPAAAALAPEQELLQAANAERVALGLAPLAPDPALEAVARLKAQDMARLGYFGHESPTFGSPFAMLRRFGVPFTAAAENLAASPTMAGAHQALMASPVHRQNILNPAFCAAGMGTAPDGAGRLLVVQLFRC